MCRKHFKKKEINKFVDTESHTQKNQTRTLWGRQRYRWRLQQTVKEILARPYRELNQNIFSVMIKLNSCAFTGWALSHCCKYLCVLFVTSSLIYILTAWVIIPRDRNQLPSAPCAAGWLMTQKSPTIVVHSRYTRFRRPTWPIWVTCLWTRFLFVMSSSAARRLDSPCQQYWRHFIPAPSGYQNSVCIDLNSLQFDWYSSVLRRYTYITIHFRWLRTWHAIPIWRTMVSSRCISSMVWKDKILSCTF